MALAASLFTPSPALAGPVSSLEVSQREVEPARPVAAIIPQERIASSIDLGRILFPSHGGGALGSLIIAGMDRTPEKLAQNAAAKAETQIAPLLEVMSDFDAAAHALKATGAAAAGTGWLGTPEAELYAGTAIAQTDAEAGDSTVSMTYATGSFGSEANDTLGAMNWTATRDQLVDNFVAAHPSASELAMVVWRYQMSADFTHVEVIADITLRRKGASDDFYSQQLISVVKLRRPTFVEEDNVAIWAADDAALARRALEMAFARAGEVLPAVLALDAAGLDAATDKGNASVTSAGYHGPQLLRDETGPVFFAKDGDQRLEAFVTVQTIRN